MSKTKKIVRLILQTYLGIIMVSGGVDKFAKPMPEPHDVVAKATKFNFPEKKATLQKILYISGAKQTGYFWEVLGFCELLFGLLLLLQGTAFVGALFLLPISLHIFLFHLFLEPEEYTELFHTALLLSVNIALVLSHRERWKHLLWQAPW